MFKLVVLFSLAAMAAAKPGVVVPATYSAVVPAVSSLSQYSVHGAPAVYSAPAIYSRPAVYGAPTVYHSLHKRSLVGAAPLTYSAPALYNTPAVYGSSTVYGAPTVYGSSAVVPVAPVSTYHHLHKRSLAYSAAVSPISYSSPVVSAYSPVSPYSAPVVTSPVAYSSVYPRPLGVFPY